MKGKVSKQKALELLKKRVEELDSLPPRLSKTDDLSEFNTWKTNTIHTLENIFMDMKYFDFKNVHYSLSYVTNYTTDDEHIKAHNNGRKNAKSLLLAYIKEIEEFWEDDNIVLAQQPKQIIKQPKEEVKLITNEKKIFIVHGHDNEMKLEVARFLDKLGLDPIILHEQASEGKTIIEKIEAHTNVRFGIVLYSPCDIGGKDTDNLNPRARQNVVFEHGYLIAKLERKNVVALVKDSVEIPSDISGIVYIPMKDNWQLDISKEMKSAGLDVDFNKLFQ